MEGHEALQWPGGPGGEVTVLTARVLRVGGHAYYLDEPGGPPAPRSAAPSGREVPGRVPAERRWAGSGAATLGLVGEVEPVAFAALLRGAHPATGELLGPRRGVEVGAYDLTFSAPKSVSLLALVGPRELAAVAGDAHRTAVADAVGYVERAALRARRSHGGHVSLLATGGLVAGAFGHRTSRDLDPHLHTHLVVANVVHGADGRWTAVDSRRIFAHVRSAGLVYQASLRAELTARAGVAWAVSERGLGDVVGVPAPLRRLYSQRAAAITRYLAAAGEPAGGRPGGEEVRATRRAAFYVTRPAKEGLPAADQLAAEWRARAADCGFDLGVLGRVVGRARVEGRSGPGDDSGRAAARLAAFGPERLLARRDVVAVLAASATSGARVGELEQAADRLLDSCARHGRGRTSDERWREPRWPAGVVAEAVTTNGLVLSGERDGAVRGPDRDPSWRALVRDGARPGAHRAGADLGR